jgi:hypothetical protein
MHETTITDVLLGRRPAADLNAEALNSIERVDAVHERIHVDAPGRPFEVSREMLLRLCDAALAGELEAIALRAIAFAIVTSDDLVWSDDLVAEILHDWSAPEVNLSLDNENLRRFREWLALEQPYPERPGAAASGSVEAGQRVFETTRVSGRA